MEENIVEIYMKELQTTDNPGVHLAKFLWEVIEKSPDNSDIIMINRFIRLYGRELVFFSILDLADFDKLNKNNLNRLIAYLLKKKSTEKYKEFNSRYYNLSDYLDKMKKKLDRKTKLKENTVE